MRYFYDTEFLEDGRTIELISIGVVRQDGREYYAVVRDAPWERISRHPWLMANVVPHLPQPKADRPPGLHLVDAYDSAVKPREQIAQEVRDFLLADGEPELWAWYGAYDHVVLMQLWGAMIKRPEGLPMWTNDLRQEVRRLGDPELPKQVAGEHNALADARHVKLMYDFLLGE